jgi:hypothetical protein
MKSAQGMPNNLVMVRRASLPLALRGPNLLLRRPELALSRFGVTELPARPARSFSSSHRLNRTLNFVEFASET